MLGRVPRFFLAIFFWLLEHICFPLAYLLVSHGTLLQKLLSIHMSCNQEQKKKLNGRLRCWTICDAVLMIFIDTSDLLCCTCKTTRWWRYRFIQEDCQISKLDLMFPLKLFLLMDLLGTFLWYTLFHTGSYQLNILNLTFKASVRGVICRD